MKTEKPENTSVGDDGLKEEKERLVSVRNGIEKYSGAAQKLEAAEKKLQGALKMLTVSQVCGVSRVVVVVVPVVVQVGV